MKKRSSPAWSEKSSWGPTEIATGYFLLGILWILFSDRIAERLAPNAGTLYLIGLYKGWGFILVTAILLYFLIKRHAQKVREVNEKYRFLAENASDVIWLLDPAVGRFKYISPSVLGLRGYTAEEVMTMPLNEAFLPGDVERLAALTQERIVRFQTGDADTVSFTDEIDQPRRDGSVVPTEVTTTYLFDSRRRIEIVGVTRDITERKQAERKLRESEENYQGLLNQASDGIFIADAKGRYTIVNEQACRLVGYSREELLSMNLRDLAAPEELETNPLRLDELKAGKTLMVERKLVHRDGSRINCEISARMLPDGRFQSIVRDITERKVTEDALKRSESRYRSLFENMPNGFARCQMLYGPDDAPIDFMYLDVNNAFRKLTGLKDAVGRRISDLIPDIHRSNPELLEIYHRVASTGQSEQFETYVPGLGAGIWLSISAYSSEQGFFVALFEDVTERKGAEKRLRESEARFSKIFRASPIGINIFRLADARSVDVNDAFTEFTGYPREEVVGHSAAELNLFVNPEARQVWVKALQENKGVYNQDADIRRKDGEIRNALASIDVIDISGEKMGLVLVADITDRKQSEEKLRRRTEELEQLLDILPEAIWIADDPECRVIRGNRFANDLLGVSKDQNISQSAESPAVVLRQFSQGRELTADELPMQAAARTGKPQLDLELRIEHPDKAPRTLLGGAIPLFDSQGSPRGVIANFHDITERKRMEEELRRSNAELEQFAYVASHDLQEPLRAVAGMVQLLGQRYKGRLDERADEYIGHAVEASGRMQALINDLLVFSRVDRRGKLPEPVNAGHCLALALRNLDVAIRESGAQVRSEELPTVTADALQLVQLFQNLIGNSIKFRGGKEPQVHVRAERLEDAWQFSVSDNGIGIEPQYFERIFLVFQRLHTRREYAGNGIGLALCKKIVERHGGRIWVESHPGSGSTFHFTIPTRSKE